jgi:CRP-like cAMP-binding protein
LAPFVVVVSAPIAITIIGAEGTLIKVHQPGGFAGEVTMLTGRRTLFRAWATRAGEVVELDRECFLSLIRTDAELGEIIMRAFILRRVAQAAVFLAQTARRVHLIVRAPGLAETMSSYLIRRIEENPAITFHSCTEIVRLSEMSNSRASRCETT